MKIYKTIEFVGSVYYSNHDSFCHSWQVYNRFKRIYGHQENPKFNKQEFEDLSNICLLHDVIEDCGIESKEAKFIKDNYSGFIYDTVLCLSRNKNEQYFSYIERVTKNKYASIVKLCDLLVNIDRSEIGSSRINRYLKAANIIVKVYPDIYEHK